MIAAVECKNLIQKYIERYPEEKSGKETLDFIQTHSFFWKRDFVYGHLTASSWIINKSKDKALLIHHKKLERWFQLGGHIELEDDSIYEACEREIREEAGISELKRLSDEIFDMDIHEIPAHKSFPSHLHFDIRILYEADESEKILFDPLEAKNVAWILLSEIEQYTSEESVLRMVRKTNLHLS